MARKRIDEPRKSSAEAAAAVSSALDRSPNIPRPGDVKSPKREMEEVERRYLAFGFSSGTTKAFELDPEDDLFIAPSAALFCSIVFARTGERAHILKDRVEWWSEMTMRVRREVKRKTTPPPSEEP